LYKQRTVETVITYASGPGQTIDPKPYILTLNPEPFTFNLISHTLNPKS